jgi:hypothetical protein
MNPRTLCLAACAALAAACGGSATGSPDSGSPDAGTAGCGAQVLIEFFSDADCLTKVGSRRYDTSLTCFSWTAQGSNAQQNSATRFQCYRDRLCYTQHPTSLTCEGGSKGQTDKQARTDACLKEPDGVLYSKIAGGTEACPAAPSGFECPSSAAQSGTAGIVACSSQ